AMYDRTLDVLRRLPAVTGAAIATSLPLGGWRFGTTFVVDGVATDPARPTSALRGSRPGRLTACRHRQRDLRTAIRSWRCRRRPETGARHRHRRQDAVTAARDRRRDERCEDGRP